MKRRSEFHRKEGKLTVMCRKNHTLESGVRKITSDFCRAFPGFSGIAIALPAYA